MVARVARKGFMMGGGASKTVTEAPAHAQKGLETIANDAGDIYSGIKSNGVNNVYQGNRVAALTDDQTAAMGRITGQNTAYNGLRDQSATIGNSLGSQGMTAGQQAANDTYSNYAQNGLDSRQTAAGGVYNGYAQNGLGARQEAAGNVYSQMSSGDVDAYRKAAMETMSGMGSASNDNFERMLSMQSREMSDQINRNASFSGRYGSGIHQNLLTRDIGDMQAKAMSDNYFNNQNLKMGAASNLYNMQSGLNSERMGAANAMAGLDQQNYSNRMGAANGMAGLGQQNYANRMGAANNMATLGQQGFQNKVGAYGLNRQAEGDITAQYGRALTVGNARQNQNQNVINANMGKHAQELAAPYADLTRYNNSLNGTMVGGTTSSTKPSAGLGGIIGGGIGGATMGSAFGPMGTLIGGGLGAIGGAFS